MGIRVFLFFRLVYPMQLHHKCDKTEYECVNFRAHEIWPEACQELSIEPLWNCKYYGKYYGIWHLSFFYCLVYPMQLRHKCDKMEYEFFSFRSNEIPPWACQELSIEPSSNCKYYWIWGLAFFFCLLYPMQLRHKCDKKEYECVNVRTRNLTRGMPRAFNWALMEL